MKNLVGLNELSEYDELETAFDDTGKRRSGNREGKDCVCSSDLSFFVCQHSEATAKWYLLDLQGGSIGPGLMTYGSLLDLVEIRLESSPNDGKVLDLLIGGNLPSILAKREGGLVRAAGGLLFECRNTS